jgi:hypothetical protein
MKAKPQMSLAEMAARSVGGLLECPKCGCKDFRTDKTVRGYVSTFRRKVCRNCGRAIETVQAPEQFVREIEPRDAAEGLESDDYGDSVL